MKIACWSGPRNISTALMRSWSSRSDTAVIDEPFYLLFKTKKLKHPMYKEIINHYPHLMVVKSIIKENQLKKLVSKTYGSPCSRFRKYSLDYKF